MSTDADPLQLAAEAFRRGDLGQAEIHCHRALKAQPRRAQAWVMAGQLAKASADYQSLCDAAARAADLEPGNLEILLFQAEALVLAGQLAQAKALARAAETLAGSAADWAAIGQFHTAAADHAAALAAYRRAADLAPEDPAALANLAGVLSVTGAREQAERAYDRALARDPLDADSHYNRATLRRVSSHDNHIDAMQAALREGPRDDAPLCYALAKELEDCGEYSQAWHYLQRGARSRRARLTYRVERDEQTMAEIARHFDARWWARQRRDRSGEAPGPIFVLGLPRSGTTLVDRILGSHSQVASLGEINDLALALVRAAGPHADRSTLTRRGAMLDMAALGRDYRATTAQYGAAGLVLLDKTPLNFLYLGVIAAALPGARVVHLRRHPIATCHALYKTLFRMACPFSYDLGDLARYYLSYRRLMFHWRELLGADAWLDIDYEALVQSPDTQVRTLVADCGLSWEPACLEFHNNPAPVATASAAQVREPVHTRSVELWRHYSDGLAPLAEQLRQAGVTDV